MTPGSILSTQIPSDRSQYEPYEVWFNKIDHIHTYEYNPIPDTYIPYLMLT